MSLMYKNTLLLRFGLCDALEATLLVIQKMKLRVLPRQRFVWPMSNALDLVVLATSRLLLDAPHSRDWRPATPIGKV